MSERQPWWGEVALETGQVGFWQLGPLSLWIKRREHEWRLALRRDPALRDGPARVEVPTDALPEDGVELSRYGLDVTTAGLRILPALAPRPVVCRPETPFVLLPGSSLTAYVSSPLWVRVESVDGPFAHVVDVHQPSGSWFGPNTREGELCYASRTRLRLHKEDIQHTPSRAITEVHLSNAGPEPLTISQLNVPVPYLDLAAAPDGTLWTQAVAMGSQATGLVAISIEEILPARELRVLAPAQRERPEQGLISALAHVLR